VSQKYVGRLSMLCSLCVCVSVCFVCLLVSNVLVGNARAVLRSICDVIAPASMTDVMQCVPRREGRRYGWRGRLVYMAVDGRRDLDDVNASVVV
jgi:hypothetical protein